MAPEPDGVARYFARMSGPLPFSPATLRWFNGTFGGPTEVQARGWPLLAAPERPHALLVAPTGSGKTLAAFLAAIDRLAARPVEPMAPPAAGRKKAPPPGDVGVRVLYVSPLKALVHDVERNLQAPLHGITRAAAELGVPMRPLSVDMRTGDTPERDRRRFARAAADILVTTPESLYLILGSAAREMLRTVETVIVDEIHALADTKRGVHLALSLERLDGLCGREVQRIGLSATVRPIEAVASFLAGGRPVEIVDAHAPPRMELTVEAFLADGVAAAKAQAQIEGAPVAGFALDRVGGWPALHLRLIELIRQQRSTIVFTNSRRLCERLAQRLNELSGQELARAHHGSVAREQRLAIEERLKAGELPAVIATGTLELGIDMGAVDQVVLVESPGSVARALQRVGRAGHHVGGVSRGTLFPRFRVDLIECAVITRGMRAGAIEALRAPTNCLDVLAQQIVAMADERPWPVDDLYALVRRAWPYRELPRAAFDATLEMLGGRYLSGPLATLPPRLTWDRTLDIVSARRGAGTIARLNAGAIPDRGNFAVHVGANGPRIGELDEEMVYESIRGDTFLLGASTWRIEEITRDRVIVTPAPGESGRMPFWRGDSPGRPLELGLQIGAFLREMNEVEPETGVTRLMSEHAFTEEAARELLRVIADQRLATTALPTDRTLLVERFPDEGGDTRVCIHAVFGAPVLAAWAIAIEGLLGRQLGTPVRTLYSDDGITLRLAAGDATPNFALLVPDPDEVEELLLERLIDSPLFGARFRENAARALLLPRQRPGKRTPLWAQRIRSQNLLATVRAWPDFPILLETFRECLYDIFDLPGLIDILSRIRAGSIRIVEVETRMASPLARSLAYRWVATWLYELDGPAAERRAQALAIDRSLLDALTGRPSWVDLLDEATLADVEAELQALAPGWQARDADTLHDVLRRLGDLEVDELQQRAEDAVAPWLETLRTTGRVVPLTLGSSARFVAMEDAERYAAAFGSTASAGEPGAFVSLLRTWARTHGPFLTSTVAARWGLPAGVVEAVLEQLREEGVLQRGRFRAGVMEEWCDNDVLRRLKRRALERARGDTAAVPAAAYARFLSRWQGVGSRATHPSRLMEVIEQIEGCPLPFSDLEARILPVRVAGYRPTWLDALGAAGEVVWIGFRPLGDTDGRVALYRRDRLALLVEPPPRTGLGALPMLILEILEGLGASFLLEIHAAVRDRMPAVDLEGVVEVLWSLVWAGQVSNDTFLPLRTRLAPPRRGLSSRPSGRWSPVSRLLRRVVSPTERLHAWTETLLRRYGVVSTRVAAAEELPQPGAIYPVLRALEEAGRARRGHFVDGLGGAQFALPGAVDALRAATEPDVAVLAATDPAHPWGTLLERTLPGLRRAAGVRVVLVDGELVVAVDRAGRSVLLAGAGDEAIVRALTALREDSIRGRDRDLRVERVGGEPARESLRRELFLRAGFLLDPGGRGLVVPA